MQVGLSDLKILTGHKGRNKPIHTHTWQRILVCIFKFGLRYKLQMSAVQLINFRLLGLRHDKMQANNSKQKGNIVSKKKAGLENKPKN